MVRDTEYAYRAVSIPWMSPYEMAIEVNAKEFNKLFLEEIHHLKMINRRSIDREMWEFLGLWRPRFPGDRPMTLLVFRSRSMQ